MYYHLYVLALHCNRKELVPGTEGTDDPVMGGILISAGSVLPEVHNLHCPSRISVQRKQICWQIQNHFDLEAECVHSSPQLQHYISTCPGVSTGPSLVPLPTICTDGELQFHCTICSNVAEGIVQVHKMLLLSGLIQINSDVK